MSNYNYSKNKHCKCGKSIDNRSTRCKQCNIIFYKGINNPNFKNGKTHYNKCIDCGEHISFEAIRCMSCASKERIKTIDFTGEKNFNYKTGKCSNIFTKCVDCGIVIDYRAIRCVECYHKYNIGEHNPAYIHGLGNLPYSSEFTNELKESIRKRDNHICQNPECNMTEEEHLIVYGRAFHVHHIDYNKENCKETNLITVCFGCNIRANYNRPYWQEIYIKIIGEKNLFPTAINDEDKDNTQKEISSPLLKLKEN